MCGIAGLIDVRCRGAGERLGQLGRRMATAMAHRGPDGEGVWTDDAAGLVLAHRRLAVVDLSPAGAQPMVSANGRFVLAYNGEVYGFEALRHHPALAGVRWRGHSDTEVILESVAHRGVEATLEAIDGMFALALWDRETRTLHLARDRLGIKPLFVAEAEGRLAFASELRCLHALGAPLDVEPGAVAAFLRYGHVPAPWSIYQGVTKLRPGERLTRHPDGRIERRSYWQASEMVAEARTAPLAVDDEAAADRLEALLGEAVARQMIADVPLGVFLSGGIDSSTVTAMMVRADRGPVRSFAIGFPDAGFDESPHAAAVAQALGTEHTTLMVTGTEALATVPRLADLYDEPFADASAVPTHLLAKLTRAHVTVALSGDGGDELFLGYNRHAFAAGTWRRLRRLPPGLRRPAAHLLQTVPEEWIDRTLGRLPGLPPQIGDKVQKVARILGEDEASLYLRLVSQVDHPEHHLAAAEVVPPTSDIPGLDPVDRMRLADTLGYLPDDILQKVDRAAMAVALEVRPPLLDRHVVAFAWRLPRHQLIRNGEAKWLLRRVLERHLPRDLIDRPKQGFTTPLAAWLRGPLRDWGHDLLHGSDYGGGLLDPAPARALWQRHQTGRTSEARQLWPLLMLEAWRQRWHPTGPIQEPPAGAVT
ncbi:MAG: asparagine synthase (glutamine-hydrolyzing) [Pseudomonadota bacterium]